MNTHDETSMYLHMIAVELRAAQAKFAPFNSAHEGYAVLREEVDELWDEIKRNDLAEARKEAVQVAAMALRFLCDVGTKIKTADPCDCSGEDMMRAEEP